MTATTVEDGQGAVSLDLVGLEALRTELEHRGYEVYGPQVRDGAIVHDVLRSVDDLPLGWTDEQAGGRYRLVPRDDDARFGYAVGPQSWKELLHPPKTKVWTIGRASAAADNPTPAADEVAVELHVRMHEPEPILRAFLGVRPCELAAILKQDRVLLDGPHPDPAYRANRQGAFLIAVNCGDPAATCFCTSMGTGPGAGPGYDLVLTELVDTRRDGVTRDVRYIAEVGSDRGAEVLDAITTTAATDRDWRASRQVVAEAGEAISRRLDTDGIKELMYDNLESSQWDDIAERCLSCGNCTLACPTCFCTDLEDVTDLSGDNTDRWRVWDSCFSLEFSHLGPGPLRSSTSSRYRQWLVHKLASWHDQFDESGCVGCGRCITWCPVGIDLTKELATMRQDAKP